MTAQLQHEDLIAQLEYNPTTGEFTRFIEYRGVYKIVGSKNSKGYVCVYVNNKAYKAHRLAHFYMTGCWPDGPIDHRDQVRHNNKWDNLRVTTCLGNSQNKAMMGNNTSGFNGVYWRPNRKTWRAKITVDKVVVSLGTFQTKDEAIRARQAANIKYGFSKRHGH